MMYKWSVVMKIPIQYQLQFEIVDKTVAQNF